MLEGIVGVSLGKEKSWGNMRVIFKSLMDFKTKKGNQCYFKIQDTEPCRYLFEQPLLPDSIGLIVRHDPRIVMSPVQSRVAQKICRVSKIHGTERLRFDLIYRRTKASEAKKPEFECSFLTDGCGLQNITFLRFLTSKWE